MGQDCGTIVCNGDVPIWGDEDFVKTLGTLGIFMSLVFIYGWVPKGTESEIYQRGLDEVGNCSGREDMGLDSFYTVLPLLLTLTTD